MRPVVQLWLLCGLGAACGRSSPAPQPPSHEEIVLKRAGAQRLHADLDVPNSRVEVRAGDCEYAQIDARYRSAVVVPEVVYDVDEGQGNLSAREHPADPGGVASGRWNFCLDESLPVDLTLESRGATIGLSELRVHELAVDGRDGHVELDMLEVDHSMHVEIRGGLTAGLKPPQRAGMRVTIKEAGKLNLDGLTRVADGSFVNERWNQPDVPQIDLVVAAPGVTVFTRTQRWTGKWR